MQIGSNSSINHDDFAKITDATLLPTLRHAVGDTGVLMAGEAEAYEPLAVKLPRCLFQECHPPPVVLNQVVVGGED